MIVKYNLIDLWGGNGGLFQAHSARVGSAAILRDLLAACLQHIPIFRGGGLSLRDSHAPADKGDILFRAAGHRRSPEVAGPGNPDRIFAAYLSVPRPQGEKVGDEPLNRQKDIVPQLCGQAEVAQIAQRVVGLRFAMFGNSHLLADVQWRLCGKQGDRIDILVQGLQNRGISRPFPHLYHRHPILHTLQRLLRAVHTDHHRQLRRMRVLRTGSVPQRPRLLPAAAVVGERVGLAGHNWRWLWDSAALYDVLVVGDCLFCCLWEHLCGGA